MIAIQHWGMISGILSLLCIMMSSLVFMIIQKRVPSFFARLTIYLLIADIPLLISSFFGIPVAATVSTMHCDLMSFTLQFSNLSTSFWNLIIIWTVYHTVRYSLMEEELDAYRKKFLVISYLIPTVIALIPIVVHWGTSSSCWINIS